MTSDTTQTLDGALRRRAAELPNHVVYRYLQDGETESHQLTYGSINARARALAARLQALGKPGQPVLVLCDDGLEPLVAFFGCLYAGMIAVPLAPPRPRQPPSALATVAADAGASTVLGASSLVARALPRLQSEPSLARLKWLAIDADGDDGPGADDWRAPNTSPGDVAALLYTSGSTSQPKGVVLTHTALWGPPFDVPPAIDPTWSLNSVSWMPLYHMAGLSGALIVLRVGNATDVRVAAEPVLEQPVRWLRAISRYRALSSGAPNFLYQLCVDRVAPEERAGLDLRLWLFASCIAEPIRAETLEQFAAAYAPAGFRPQAFIPGYGLSELPGVAGRMGASAPRVGAFDRTELAQNRVAPVADDLPGAVRLVSNGPPASGVTVRIVDPASETVCPPALVGEVWTASEYAAAGYWNRPEATAETFQAQTADTGEGPFLRTGDLGFIYEEELYICGRIKDIIIIRGQNYYAQDIEAAVAGSHPDLGGAAAAFAVPAATGKQTAGGEQVVIYYEVRPECTAPDVPAISAAIRRAVSRELQLPIYAVVLVEAGALPRTGVGKIRRYLVREQFIATQMSAPASATSPTGGP